MSPTRTTARSSWASKVRERVPPASVNFTALENRLFHTRESNSLSASTSTSSWMSVWMSRPFSSQAFSKVSKHWHSCSPKS